jgi:hypothetical protein
MFNMFTDVGNQKVSDIVAQAKQLADVNEGSIELVYKWALNELAALSSNVDFEEAEDTLVRESVLAAI